MTSQAASTSIGLHPAFVQDCCEWFEQSLISSVLMRQALQKNLALGLGPWLDLGTGSGAVALGLASILPTAAQVKPHHLLLA